MTRVRFWSRGPSKGLKRLKLELRSQGVSTLTLKRGGTSRFIPRHNDLIINWGYQAPLPRGGCHLLNNPDSIGNASNKLIAFNILFEHEGTGDNLPDFTTEEEEARTWVEEGSHVYCRTRISSNSGRGIVIARSPEEVQPAPLYTRGLLHIQREVRVHVFRGRVIDLSQKKKMNRERREEEGIELNEEIRNYSNGYIFARESVEVDGGVQQLAIDALAGLGLDFGSVDIVETANEPIILEVNTASGMEGTTVDRYVHAIKQYIEEEILG